MQFYCIISDIDAQTSMKQNTEIEKKHFFEYKNFLLLKDI